VHGPDIELGDCSSLPVAQMMTGVRAAVPADQKSTGQGCAVDKQGLHHLKDQNRTLSVFVAVVVANSAA
jgi:hypothetical protein